MKNHNFEHTEKQQQSSHAVHALSSTKKGLVLSLILTGSFFVVELIVGLQINSVAVIADAAHNFSAAAGITIALIATILASKAPTARRTFGFFKVEILAAWINGFLLLGMAYIIVNKGIHNLLNPVVVATLPMIILSVIGLVIGGIPAILLYKKQKTDINARGAFWHVMETVFGSAAVLAAALVMTFTGWVQADAIFGMLLAPVLVIASFSVIWESTRTLIDLTPKDLDLLKVKKDILEISGVENIHHMHAWNVTSGKTIFSAHVKISDAKNNTKILEKINLLLKEKHNIFFSTIQLETYYYNNIKEETKEIDFI